ncbi:MAG: membrane protein insertase YidC [Desulfarculaceae bacterium]|nr:membrane protein insertase YidC [Desulfarculaceae bacterium]MCF8073630.1 membrane protein insertase YidC [Desulfarculaceae bacterium]MCF8103138.1 membrane protein insertase YidC [Desulfarculaceae bacterium]MCF8115654.1 membrane protein insertase YidC [Desulfarculaceae bacterium]
MDQKRMLLALALSVGLMWLWIMFFGDKPQEQPVTSTTAPQSQASKAPAAAGTPQVSAPASPSAAAPAVPTASPAGAETLVEVRTPLYTAVFTSRGGGVKTVILQDYYNQPEQKGGHFAVLDLGENDPASLAVNLTKLDPKLSARNFTPSADKLEVSSGSKQLVFTTTVAGVKVDKVYTFKAGSYAWELNLRLTNQSGKKLELQPSIALVEMKKRAESAAYAFTGIQYSKAGRYEEMSAGDLDDNPKDTGDISYLGLSIPYFLGAVAPLEPQGQAPPKRFVVGGEKGELMLATLVEPLMALEPGATRETGYMIFYGPKDLKVLEPLGHNLDQSVDFGWFDVIAKPFLIAMNLIFDFIGNYGIAIIIVTLITKLIFWPLTRKSYKSMKEMQKLQPHVKRLREKFKDDKQRMNQEIMQLYKTYKVNPAGGCLPMLVQIPVFIAFYKVLGNAIELRHAPFMLWINDLSAPDRLSIGIQIPYVGDGIPVLTLLMGASMFLQQKMTPTTGDPTQAKMMMMMPVVFTVMFINFPSGLVLYWLVNNLMSIGQQYYTNRSKS